MITVTVQSSNLLFLRNVYSIMRLFVKAISALSSNCILCQSVIALAGKDGALMDPRERRKVDLSL